MNRERIKFPYPVLGHADDVDGAWGCNYLITQGEDEIEVEVQIEFLFDDLHQLIKEKKACYICEVNCNRTFLRYSEQHYDDEFTIKINRKDIRDMLSLSLLVISTENQEMYQSEKFKPFYKDNHRFLCPLEKGEILAQLPEYKIPVDIEYDEINTQPIIEIKKSDDANEEFEYVNLNNDAIQVVLPQNTFEKLEKIKNNQLYLSIFHSSFISNALFQAILDIEGNTDRMWAQKLQIVLDGVKFKDLDINENTSQIVQLLLEKPYDRMTDDLITLNTD